MPIPRQAPAEAMLQMIAGFRASRVIHVAARLRLADALHEGPLDAAALAAATATHGPSLERLLRALVSLGVVEEIAGHRYGLTPLGATLESQAPGSLRAWAELALGGEHYASWGDLEDSIRHGGVAFDQRFGMTVWEYRRQNESQGRLFDEAMAALTTGFEPELVGNAALAEVRTLVDVGGGDGSLLITLLECHPTMRGVLFDLPHIVATAETRIHAAGLASRCDVVGGDVFDSVPAGADGYLLSRVLHDWDDRRARAVLESCHRAIAPGGKLLAIERLLPERFDASPAAQTTALGDLAMMVMTGGRERTFEEFDALFRLSGFHLRRHERMPSGIALMDALPA
jgi:hypothetical protein